MTSLLLTARLMEAKRLCFEQTRDSDLPSHRLQGTHEFKLPARNSLSAMLFSSLVAVSLTCALMPQSYAQTRGRAQGEAATQAAAPTSNTNDDALTASNAAETDKTTSGTRGPSSTVADPETPPAVQRQLQLMQTRISQLEQQLKEGGKTAGPSTVTAGTAPSVTESATAPAVSRPEGVEASPQTDSKPSQAATEKPEPTAPFAYADWTWLNGTARNKDVVWDSKFFTPEIRFDTNFVSSFNHPQDDTIGGSSEIFRSNEIQVEQISFGGDFHWQNVRGRVLTMNGMFGVTTPRNDASPGRGQWDLRGAYKYVSEAYGGYHWNVNHGLNLDAGIFVSYIGLFSYYNFDNWAYQPSYVSSNTPWFFNGVRIQWLPTAKLKIEPWIINGWQSYGRFGTKPGLGGQILYRPKPWLSLVFNNYGFGEDTLWTGNVPLGRTRIHTDDSIQVKYY